MIVQYPMTINFLSCFSINRTHFYGFLWWEKNNSKTCCTCSSSGDSHITMRLNIDCGADNQSQVFSLSSHCLSGFHTLCSYQSGCWSHCQIVHCLFVLSRWFGCSSSRSSCCCHCAATAETETAAWSCALCTRNSSFFFSRLSFSHLPTVFASFCFA